MNPGLQLTVDNQTPRSFLYPYSLPDVQGETQWLYTLVACPGLARCKVCSKSIETHTIQGGSKGHNWSDGRCRQPVACEAGSTALQL